MSHVIYQMKNAGDLCENCGGAGHVKLDGKKFDTKPEVGDECLVCDECQGSGMKGGFAACPIIVFDA